MLVRIAACAAGLFAGSVSVEIHGGGLSFAGAAVAVAQEKAQARVIAAPDLNVDTKGKTQVAR
jgi:hypothetical protein